MESAVDYWTSKALLDWQVEMGADEAIADAPIDRYALEDKKPAPKVQTDPAKMAPPPPPAETPQIDVAQAAQDAAAAASDLDGLRAAMLAYEHCDLKAAARHFIFSDGVAGAPVMILTDAPDRDDDRAGQLMSGPTGVLFDKMIGAIGLNRVGENAVYMAPVLPWNPSQNRDPSAAELAMMTPFLRRHIELAAPKLVVLMGNAPCQALLGRSGMTRLRGRWVEVDGVPALPIFPPSFLLTNSAAKRDAWADLLALQAKLKDVT
ncbi:uracil-DNA glycosylase [Pseudooctadecabacter jejudonensis]|uniref:Uracil DNA glycosylase superfamily protein n=1 Tax=Pseudooctadecabacter jejudonensis TaxID=1391910 RepID=A0A1Y5T237_9RHOB|nr:uracil-DNA glycosylase [Pseudooctadecabacter jejudonensis]SLN53676.1 Uracil DNA glycosylase superfamily protein [Pseudooctadecabacter jejudonensis]